MNPNIYSAVHDGVAEKFVTNDTDTHNLIIQRTFTVPGLTMSHISFTLSTYNIQMSR